MTPERYQRVGELFGEALELAPEDRAGFLAEACGTDVELRHELESLLTARALAENFIALNMRRSMDATDSTSEGSHQSRTATCA